MWLYQPVNAVTTGVVEADGSASGTSTVAAVGCAFALAVASAVGVGAANANAIAIFSGVGNAAGVGVASAASVTVKPGVGNAAGVGAANGDGEAVVGGGVVETTGSSSGVAVVSGSGVAVFGVVGSSVGTSTVVGLPDTATETVGAASGSSTANAVSGSLNVSVASAAGVGTANAVSGARVAVVGNSQGLAVVNGLSPTTLPTQTSFKPIERRRVRLPKLPRGVPPQEWIETSTREFESFFHDMHYYLASDTFVSGVHSEILQNGFTITPETSTIFVSSEAPVASSASVAIKSVLNIPRIFVVINTGLNPITLKDGANTFFNGDDIVLASGRVLFLVYTGNAWVGNAL